MKSWITDLYSQIQERDWIRRRRQSKFHCRVINVVIKDREYVIDVKAEENRKKNEGQDSPYSARSAPWTYLHMPERKGEPMAVPFTAVWKNNCSQELKNQVSDKLNLRRWEISKGKEIVSSCQDTIGVWNVIIHIHKVEGDKTVPRRMKGLRRI